jgi:mannose-6-phosphate isomerase
VKETALYPLRFVPIYQHRLWGGRRLADWLRAALPQDDLIGEAWLLSDRDTNASRVAEGPLEGQSIGELLAQFPQPMLGNLAAHFSRFPLLLKFLDVSKTLSVQVHPSDAHPQLIPVGDTGKTEAWVVMETGPEARIYAGLKPNITARDLRESIANGTVADRLASFTPKSGDAVLIRAGTVHSMNDAVVFEVQQNSDTTFRLFDWNRLDAQTGRRRPLQVEQAMSCIDFTQGAVGPVTPRIERSKQLVKEDLMQCAQFGISRITAEIAFAVGANQMPRVLVCLAGCGELAHGGERYSISKGDVILLPAAVGVCSCQPLAAISLLELSVPDAAGYSGASSAREVARSAKGSSRSVSALTTP